MINTAAATRGMVVAPHHLAAQSGLAVLHEGGNAIEAMVAAAATIAVVYPHMNAIGATGSGSSTLPAAIRSRSMRAARPRPRPPRVVPITRARRDPGPRSPRGEYRGRYGVGVGGGARDRQTLGRRPLAGPPPGGRHPLRRARRSGHREPARQYPEQARRPRIGAGVRRAVSARRRDSRGGRPVRERAPWTVAAMARTRRTRLLLPRPARGRDSRGPRVDRQSDLQRGSRTAPHAGEGAALPAATLRHRIQLPASDPGPRVAHDPRHLRTPGGRASGGVRASARTGRGDETGVHGARPGNHRSGIHAQRPGFPSLAGGD